ncbi:hypothetical protein K439DRAFT_1622321 [Ramaria rubella]|nr:hypothetical protein K439DRAFT_1622321 [Ramaria rubella]
MRPGKQRARLPDIDDDGDTDLEDGIDEAEEGLDGVKDGSQSSHTKHDPHFTEIADAAAEEDAEEALESDGIPYATHTRSRKIKKELLAAFHEFIFSHITLDSKDPNCHPFTFYHHLPSFVIFHSMQPGGKIKSPKGITLSLAKLRHICKQSFVHMINLDVQSVGSTKASSMQCEDHLYWLHGSDKTPYRWLTHCQSIASEYAFTTDATIIGPGGEALTPQKRGHSTGYIEF